MALGCCGSLPLSRLSLCLRLRWAWERTQQFSRWSPPHCKTILLTKTRAAWSCSGSRIPNVAMIDESMARIFWPNADPIGQHLVISGPAPYQIVGIAGDVRQFGLDQKPQPEMYVAQDQEEWRSFTIVARCKTAPLAFTTAMTEQVHMLDKDLPVFDVRSMRQVIDQSVGDQRFSTYLFAF